MNRLFTLLLCLFMVTVVPAQQKKNSSVKQKTTATKTVVASKKTPAKKTATKTQKVKTTKAKQPVVTVQSLKDERQKIQKQIQEQKRKLVENERNVKQRLQNLMVINNEIIDKRKTIDTIKNDIGILDGNIDELNKHIHVLEQELDTRKLRFMKSLRYMHRNRNIQNRLMFIFSAQNFSQMYRRLRFVREYAVYQRAQGEAVKAMKDEVNKAAEELSTTKRQKNDLLYRGEQEKKALEGKQQEQQNVVTSLQKQQKAIQNIISQQQKKDAELNARIDKMIAEEIARAKARAEAERKRKATEEAAKKRAEELARKKAAAEAAARENARRIAEAKAREEKAKAEARAAARKSAQEKRKAEEAARKAERARREEERKAAAEARAREKEIAEENRKAKEENNWTVSTEDRKLGGSFESNRGRLPMPLTGGYKIVNRFGQYSVDGVKGNISLDNKGIKIKGQPGAYARSVFDGKVTAVFGYDGAMVVIISHGTYLTVYTNLAAVSVINGQKVTARQTLGKIGGDGIMQFQLRRGNTPLNPMSWLGR